MKTIKAGFMWAYRNFFIVGLAIFSLIYLGWSLLVPPWRPAYSFSRQNFFIGVSLTLFIGILTAVFARAKLHRFAGFILAVFIIYLGALNAHHIASHFPEIENVARYNKTVYILTYNESFIEDYQGFPHHEVTKWAWVKIPETIVLSRRGNMRFVYDAKMQLVSVVTKHWLGFEELVYTDSAPPREFDFIVDPVEFEGKRYYASIVLNTDPANPYNNIGTYRLYQCELDNTLCTSLPFQFTTEAQVEEMVIERNKATNDINIYFYWDGLTTLIFSNGTHPRCYLDGCEILK